MQVLGVSGSPSSPSKTALAIGTALDRAAEHDGVRTELLDLRGYDLVFSDGRDPAEYTGDTRTVIDRVIAADALVIDTGPLDLQGVIEVILSALPEHEAGRTS